MTKRRESREQAFTLLFEKTVTGDSMEDIIEMAKEARDVVIDPYCEKLTACKNLRQRKGRFLRKRRAFHNCKEA